MCIFRQRQCGITRRGRTKKMKRNAKPPSHHDVVMLETNAYNALVENIWSNPLKNTSSQYTHEKHIKQFSNNGASPVTEHVYLALIPDPSIQAHLGEKTEKHTNMPDAETCDISSSETTTPDGASSETIRRDGASSETVPPDDASSETSTPDGASSETITPDGASSETIPPDGAGESKLYVNVHLSQTDVSAQDSVQHQNISSEQKLKEHVAKSDHQVISAAAQGTGYTEHTGPTTSASSVLENITKSQANENSLGINESELKVVITDLGSTEERNRNILLGSVYENVSLETGPNKADIKSNMGKIGSEVRENGSTMMETGSTMPKVQQDTKSIDGIDNSGYEDTELA